MIKSVEVNLPYSFVTPSVDVFWSYRVTVSERMAAALRLWLARRSLVIEIYYYKLQALVENVFVSVQLAHSINQSSLLFQ